jgi:hypothetical protein
MKINEMTTEYLKCEKKKKALSFSHFPTKMQAVIWRNWGIIPTCKIAKVLRTTEENIVQLAVDMGLPVTKSDNSQTWLERGYITIIRKNWHLLPYEQLLELLGWDWDKLAFVLKEDDFLYIKLGSLKPRCEKVIYRPLSWEQKKQTMQIKKLVKKHFGIVEFSDNSFDFLSRKNIHKSINTPPSKGLKMLYSYSAIYGDPLLDAKLNPYPEELLRQYAEKGINAVWLQGILYKLIPWMGETNFSLHWQKRLENLRILIKSAARFGIKIYLYLNEPRNMPAEFFDLFPTWKGARENNNNSYAMCISNPEILPALRDGVSKLVKAVPELGGILTITMSENVTHCLSQIFLEECPRCKNRPFYEFPLKINQAIAEGVHNVDSQIDVIAWNWGWQKSWDEKVVELLPAGMKLMVTSESGIITKLEDTIFVVSDYSISKPGPGPTIKRLKKVCDKRGIKLVAKVQLNNTWECSAVPYIPVPFLVEEHLNNLRGIGISDFMLSWTTGGYPGGNLELLNQKCSNYIMKKFGKTAFQFINEAMKYFSDAFRNFPLHKTSQLYLAPQNYGSMNLLYAEKTNYSATMLGFPYDDLHAWCGGHFTEENIEKLFKRISLGWAEGLKYLNKARDYIEADCIDNYEDLLNVSEAAYCHFRSTYLQINFIRNRNDLKFDQCIPILTEETKLAKRLLSIIKRDSRIGFEASNHYFYSVSDLMEKVLNCEFLKEQLEINVQKVKYEY